MIMLVAKESHQSFKYRTALEVVLLTAGIARQNKV